MREEADEQTILDTFVAKYREKKGVDGKDFVKKRATIYMDIAKKISRND